MDNMFISLELPNRLEAQQVIPFNGRREKIQRHQIENHCYKYDQITT